MESKPADRRVAGRPNSVMTWLRIAVSVFLVVAALGGLLYGDLLGSLLLGVAAWFTWPHRRRVKPKG